MSTEEFKILEKIKKLLRLADISRGATPAEAATAVAKAQAMLLEHNLTVEAVGDLEAGEKPEEVGREDIPLEATYQTGRWHLMLMAHIARPMFCRPLYWPGKDSRRAGKVSLVGKPSNVAVVRYLYGYLHREIERMAVAYQTSWKTAKRVIDVAVSPNDSARVKIDFCLGAAETIGHRLEEQYKKRTNADDTSRALVVQSDHALDKAFKQHFPRTTNTGSNRRADYRAREAGRAAGKKIALHTGINGAEAQRRIS